MNAFAHTQPANTRSDKAPVNGRPFNAVQATDFTSSVPSELASHHEVEMRAMLEILGMDLHQLINTPGAAGPGTMLHSQHARSAQLLSERLPRRRVRAGQQLIQDRESLKAIYIVRTGSFKTETLDQNGVSQIVGFPMRGDLLGADGLGDGQFCANVYALEDSDVIVLTISRLAELAASYPGFEQVIYRCIARALVREQSQVWALGSQCASARLAQFFKQLSQHYAKAGYSPNAFVLRMTRTELANYLGLTVETISRTLTTMQSAGAIEVKQRQLKIVDFDRLAVFGKSGDRVSAKDLAKQASACTAARQSRQAA
jgi:CRP/FNR family transcriptional regulator, anaerobic regulatory protein